MKKPTSTFTLEVEKGSTLIGIPPGSAISITLGDGKVYSASIEKIHKAMAAWHAKANPTGKKHRRFFSSSEEMKKYLKEHPEEMER